MLIMFKTASHRATHLLLTPFNVMLEDCSSCIAPQKLHASNCTGLAVLGEFSDDEADQIELHNPGGEQSLTIFWGVEEGQPQ